MKIDPKILSELDDIPHHVGRQRTKFTAEQDAILLKCWMSKTQYKFVEWWHKRYGWGCKDTLRRRYAELAGDDE